MLRLVFLVGAAAAAAGLPPLAAAAKPRVCIHALWCCKASLAEYEYAAGCDELPDDDASQLDRLNILKLSAHIVLRHGIRYKSSRLTSMQAALGL